MDTVCLESSTMQGLKRLIIDQLHLCEDQVRSNTPLMDLDMDSIDTAELTIEVYETFGIEISIGLLDVITADKTMTIQKLSELIEELGEGIKE